MKKILLILLVCISSNAFAQWNKSVVDNGIISNDTIYIESVSFQNYLNNGDTILAHVYGYVVSDSEEFAYCIFDSTANIFLIDSVVLNYYSTQDGVNFPSDTGVAYVAVQYWYNYADLLFDNDSGGSSIADMPPYPHDSTLFLRGDSTWGLPPNAAVDVDSLRVGDSVRNSHNYEPLDIDSAHHLHQISLIGTNGHILFSHGISLGTSFGDGGAVFLQHVPNVSYPNLIEPVTSGIPPLTIRTATLSDTNAFEIYRYDATKFFIVDSGGIVNTYRGFNLNTSANPIGLDTNGALDYGVPKYVLNSDYPNTPKWSNVDSLIKGVPTLLYYANASGDLAQVQDNSGTMNGVVLVKSYLSNPNWSATPTLGEGSGVNEGQITFKGLTSGAITIKVPNAITSYDLKLPANAGTNLYFLQTNGSGTTTWAAGNSGTVTSVSGSGGTTGLTLTGGAITTSGTLTLGGTLVEANGGTNQSTYTTGDVLYASASNTLSKLAVGSTGNVLTVSGGIPSWAAPAFSATATTFDLTTNGSTTKDTVPGNILIVGTTKPGSPTFTYTVLAADIPSNTVVTNWCVFVTIGGKNTDAINSRTVNWRMTVNGSDISGSDASIAIPIATPWWKVGNEHISTPLAVGDVIGFKLWASATNQIDFRYATIYIVPRLYGVSSGFLSGAYGATTARATFAGAVAGVSYTATSIFSTSQFYDNTVATIIGNLVTGQVFMLGSSHAVYSHNTLTDGTIAPSAVTASSGLYSVNSGSLLFRYLYWYH